MLALGTGAAGHTGAQRGCRAGRVAVEPGRLATGFWGVPGRRWGGKVHLVRGGAALCGAVSGPAAEFQWCAWGLELRYIDCRRCRAAAQKIIAAEMPGRD